MINDMCRGPGGDLRRPARLRRGVAPLRSRARRHPRRAARPRPPDRPDRPRVPRGRRARTSSSCCPTTARPRARRSRSSPARRSPTLVGRLCGGGRVRRRRRRAGQAPSRRRGCARPGPTDGADDATADDVPIVLGSGSLGLISLPGEPRRLQRDEIDERYPDADPRAASPIPDDRLRARRAADGGSSVLGATGQRNLATGEVAGDDPLAPFGPSAVDQVARGRRATARSPT